jgi:hypothetical protein
VKSKLGKVRTRFRGWLHVQGYLQAPLEALDERGAQLVGKSEDIRRRVMLRTELRARTLAGQSRSAGFVSMLVVVAAFTRDQEGALAAMRLDAYTKALARHGTASRVQCGGGVCGEDRHCVLITNDAVYGRDLSTPPVSSNSASRQKRPAR